MHPYIHPPVKNVVHNIIVLAIQCFLNNQNYFSIIKIGIAAIIDLFPSSS